MTNNPASTVGSTAIPVDGLEMRDTGRLDVAEPERQKSRMTDQELLQGYVHRSDLGCLDTFMRRYQDSLLRFAAQFLGDSDLAQDVVQETFLRVAKQPKRLLTVDSCHNWLLRIVRNVGIDHIRKATRYRKHRDRAAELAPRPDASREAVGAELERDELHVRVHEEISQLEPKKRELFLLKVQEGKSYREIAQITGLSVTNVGYHLHQIMRRLAQRLSDTQEGMR